MEINGTTPGTQYDQIRRDWRRWRRCEPGWRHAHHRACAYLGLAASAGFILIDNQGSQPVSGMFNGLSEGALVTVGGQQLAISYVGCDGNDVTLGTPCGNPARDGDQRHRL